MRNSDRIQPLLKKINTIWQMEPDLRFGQVLNVISGYGVLPKIDIALIENEIWDSALEKSLEKMQGSKKHE